jgi:hypothetical protein
LHVVPNTPYVAAFAGGHFRAGCVGGSVRRALGREREVVGRGDVGGPARVGSANNTVRFNPAFLTNSPRAMFRGTNGGRMKLFGLAIDDGENAPGSNTRITGNFNGGTVDLLAEEIWIGRNRFTNTSAARAEGVMTFNNGIVDVNTSPTRLSGLHK